MITWSEDGDEFVFYEINPLVEKIAREYFSYLSQGKADSSVVLGDGRVQLQRNYESGGGKFDLIFMDAFASDSIPVHLLTTECFDVYDRNLNQDGVLIAHITNKFVDLRPVVFEAAISRGMTPILIDCRSEVGSLETRWVLMTRNEDVLNSDLVRENSTPWPQEMSPLRWTDDYTTMAALVDWSGRVNWTKLKETRLKQQK